MLSGLIIVRPECCQACLLSGLNVVRPVYCQAWMLSGLNVVRPDYCLAWMLSGLSIVRPECCQAWMMSGLNIVRPEYCQAKMLSGLNDVRPEYCQAWILSGLNIVRPECCQAWMLSGLNIVRPQSVPAPAASPHTGGEAGHSPQPEHCKLHTAHKIYTTHYTLHTTHYTLHTTHYTLYTTHYTQHTTKGKGDKGRWTQYWHYSFYWMSTGMLFPFLISRIWWIIWNIWITEWHTDREFLGYLEILVDQIRRCSDDLNGGFTMVNFYRGLLVKYNPLPCYIQSGWTQYVKDPFECDGVSVFLWT